MQEKAIWLFLVAVLSAVPVQSHGFDLGMGVTSPLQQKGSLKFTGVLQSETDFAGLQANAPVFRDEKNAFTLMGRFNRTDVEPATIPFDDLYDIQFAANYTYVFEGGKMLSVTSGFGSASDRPFADTEVNTATATALYTFPQGETGTWTFLLNYSNNRPFLNNIPLPGVAYTHAPSKKFRLTVGAPFAALYWQFADRWSLLAYTVIPWVARLQVGYSIMGPMAVYVGGDFSQNTYLQYGRSNWRERIYFDEKKVFAGIRSPLSRVFYAELETGLSFERRFFFAESYTRSPATAFELDSTLYGKLALTAFLY